VDQKLKRERYLPYILLIGGIIGIFCAAILTQEKFELIQHPNKQLICDLNPIVACGSVITQPQASAFSFPNTYIGLVGFGAVATIGAALLAGARFKKWFWQLVEAGMLFAAAFITWLQFETIFRIKALCPFCMVVWAVVIPLFIYTTLYNLRSGNITTPKNLKKVVAFAERYHMEILVSWYLIIILVILKQFWYYWKTVI